jgi:alpha-L-fucosidase
VLGEGADGKLNVLPGGKIGGWQAGFRFSTSDFRFTLGKNGDLYAWCMTVPGNGKELRIVSLGKNAKLLDGAIKKVELLGYKGRVKWKQEDDALVIQCPEMPFKTAVGFRISAK